MRYVCPGCKGEFNLPESMVPATGKFKLTCPSCGREAVLDRQTLEQAEAASPPPPPPSPQGPPAQAAPKATAGPASGPATGATTGAAPPPKSGEPDIFPPGSRVVFIFTRNDAWRDAVRQFFKRAGYLESLPGDSAEAMEKLRLNTYHAVVVDAGDETAQIRGFVDAWPGLKRRGVNLLLVGDQAPSLDPGISFVFGCNTFLNAEDHGKAEELLQSALDGFEEYYAPLNAATPTTEE